MKTAEEQPNPKTLEQAKAEEWIPRIIESLKPSDGDKEDLITVVKAIQSDARQDLQAELKRVKDSVEGAQSCINAALSPEDKLLALQYVSGNLFEVREVISGDSDLTPVPDLKLLHQNLPVSIKLKAMIYLQEDKAHRRHIAENWKQAEQIKQLQAQNEVKREALEEIGAHEYYTQGPQRARDCLKKLPQAGMELETLRELCAKQAEQITKHCRPTLAIVEERDNLFTALNQAEEALEIFTEGHSPEWLLSDAPEDLARKALTTIAEAKKGIS